MPVQKLQVFLASRFEEFSELRKILVEKIRRPSNPPADAIDLNDNSPDARAPIDRCREAIEASDVVVLLIGKTYGAEVQDGASHTHLEYRHAYRSRKNILPFLIGEEYAKSGEYRPSDPKLRAWVDELCGTNTVSRLDSRKGWPLLASEIYEWVHSRLQEVAEDADVIVLPEDGLANWEESPIRVQELAQCIKVDSSRRGLKSLASEHAQEALEALELNLPEIAVHHLKQTDELVQLEPVPGYWLSRLRLLSGRRSDWKAAQTTALRCAAVAGARGAGVPQLLRMACWIVAARASERLGYGEPALKYAQNAFDDKPFHWLAKLELGRQFALNDNAAVALKHARDAFWLNPATIYKVHTDPAYVELGEPYYRFRANLRDEVARETNKVLDQEKRVAELARDAGVSEPLQATTNFEGTSLLSMINSARLSARNSLQIFRRCAAKLAADVAAFASGPYKGLSDNTADEIRMSVKTETAKLQMLREELANESGQSRHWYEQTLFTMSVGTVITFAVALAALLGLKNPPVHQIVAAVVAVAGAILTGYAAQQAWTKHRAASAACERLKGAIEQTKGRLEVSRQAEQAYTGRASTLREHLHRFCTLVDAFEATAGKHLAYAPAVPRQRQNTLDLVRIVERGEAGEEDGKVWKQGELLPPELAALLGHSSPPHEIWFARRVHGPGGEMFRRYAAYFSA